MAEDGSIEPVSDAVGQDTAARPERTPGREPVRTRRLSLKRLNTRRVWLPVGTLVLLAIVLVYFHSVLLPFIFACAIVYLMEPLVSRMSQPREEGRGGRTIPRWAAVIVVYISFFTITTLGLLVVIPRFVSEIVRFGETVPDAVQEFRREQLPGINARVQNLLRSYVIQESELVDLEPARSAVQAARVQAAGSVEAILQARAAVAQASDITIGWELHGEPGSVERRLVARAFARQPGGPPGQAQGLASNSMHVAAGGAVAAGATTRYVSHGAWSIGEESPVSALRFVPAEQGGFDVFFGERPLEIVPTGEGGWLLREHDGSTEHYDVRGPELDLHNIFDLERTFDEMLSSIASVSGTSIGVLVEFAQSLTIGLITAFLAVVLTFMVAAFISIDLPRVQRAMRGSLPREWRPGYDELLVRLDARLGGVVRGQLMICLVNGVLVYLGLAILGVKYSVLLSVIAAVLSIIPIFGSVISTIPIVAIALTQSFTLGLLTLGWILLINFIEANFLNPKIIGTAAHIHPVIVIFALLAGRSAFGLVGAILAIPATSIVLTLFGFVRDKYGLHPEHDLDTADRPADGDVPASNERAEGLSGT